MNGSFTTVPKFLPLRYAVMFVCAAGLLSCGGDARVPGTEGGGGDSGAVSSPVAPPAIPGQSDEFKAMELPPGQILRVTPVGDAYAKENAPVFRSLCLNCHAVSQTSFAAQSWTESAHSRVGVTCSGCHGSHEGAFVTKPGPDRCGLCHGIQYEAASASAHGPQRAPGMGCAPCHEIHATDRRAAARVETCTGCHLDSEHVQGYATSRMGLVFLREGYGPDGELRAPDCVYCHMPPVTPTGPGFDFRNDKVSLHDPSVTVRKQADDPNVLAAEAVETLVPLCVKCHSERNARFRLENSASLIRTWTPVGMTSDVRRRPVPVQSGRAR